MLDIVTELPVNEVVDKRVNEPAAIVPHFNPVAVELSAVRTVSLAPTASLVGLEAALAAIMSPLVVTIVGWIPPSIEGILPTVILGYLTSES